jgi:hypothetical protein
VTTPEAPKPRRKPRVAFNLRVGEEGKAAYMRIAADRTKKTGKKVTASEVARAALAEYAAKHDPERKTR